MTDVAEATGAPAPVMQRYEADLLGNIQQALAGLQGFDIMALELIQNADDAGAATMRFDVRPDGLHVWNSERFSSCGLTETTCPHLATGDDEGIARPCNFHAISRMGSRSKINDGSQIGRFGIGFVSVYQITDSPIIRSRDLQMRLDPLNSESPTNRISEIEGTEFELAWASGQSATRNALNASPTPEDVGDRVAAGIRSVMDRGLFFLRQLERIDLLVGGDVIHAVTIERDGDVLTLTKEPEASEERWLVLKADASARADELDLKTRFPMLVELDRSPAVTVAIPLDDRPVEGLLYAYLPTEQPSRLPMHVNADFFPHPNRRAIVLTGEQHDRYWNELLLEAAAKALADSFVMLSGKVGAKRLWEIGSSAHALRSEGAFSVFWERFSEVARAFNCSWSIKGAWCALATSQLPPEAMPAEQQSALADIGLDIIHPDLRPHWTALSTLGAKTLRLSATIDALAATYAATDRPPAPPTPDLLSAIDGIVESGIKTPGAEPALARLRDVPFAPGSDGALYSLAQLRSPPIHSDADLVNAFIPEVVFAHPDLSALASLKPLVDRYDFAEFAGDLAARIETEADAVATIGTSQNRVRAFYDLLVATAGDTPETVDGGPLAVTPILRTRSGFTSPDRGLLPGGFDDPIGHLAVVDVAAMPAPMLALAQSALGVATLSFSEYIRKHLAGILADEPTQAQYRTLMREVAQHWHELSATGALSALRQMRFVRNRAGTYSRPADVYFFSAPLEAALGLDDQRWVDENWLPGANTLARLRDLLESELGLPRRATVGHLIDRIELIAEGSPDDDAAKRLTLIARHLVERLPSMAEAEQSELERLRDLEWLPASLDGKRQEYWYSPGEVYRPFRATGFASQACVVDLPVFRSTQVRGLTDFLDFLEMPDEPPTSTVVAHLAHCMANDQQPSDIAYQMLSEGVEDHAGDLEPLRDTAFIYVAADKRWLSADEVFWEAPPFRGRWHAASQNMHLRSPLYRHLGVSDRPAPRHYAKMLVQLADAGQLGADDLAVHDRCLAVVAEAIEAGTITAEDLRREIGSSPILVNRQGQLTFPEDAIWANAEWLAAPFGQALDDQLVATPVCARNAAARLFRALGVQRLTSVARLRLAADPDGRESTEVTERIAERADLLLWLAPNAAGRDRLLHALLDLEVRLTDALSVQAELQTSDPPTRSAAAPVAAFYEADGNVLHMREAPGAPLDWSAAFRDLFAQLNLVPHETDVRPVIMAAVYVVGAASSAEAEQALRTADYRPPSSREGMDGERGEAFDDLEDEVDNGADDEVDRDDAGDGLDEPDPAGSDDEPIDEAEDANEEDGDDEAEGDDTPGNGSEGGGAGDGSNSGGTRVGGGQSSGGSGSGTGTGAGTGGGSTTQGGNGSGGTGGGEGSSGSGSGSQNEGQTRRSRLLAYVVSSKNASTDSNGSSDRARAEAAKIDIAAIEAALKYERNARRVPIEQSHSNPGFDIRSAHEDGAGSRLIEVKGLASGWNERGIKLTGVQYEMAREHPEQFWIYVVENACDLEKQKVHAIANPFSKVAEYWFDHGWSGTAEETGGARELNLVAGVRLKHRVWGIGTVISVERKGASDFVLIEFSIDGRKNIPFNSMLTFVE
ncbi:DUF3883 domain-containing protein [Sphingomonadaceae bacterium OTU29THOMA1]|nr:DUF3883 domain-containing protein [Sphingomonadaceae bacterium OTU29THOMA1]